VCRSARAAGSRHTRPAPRRRGPRPSAARRASSEADPPRTGAGRGPVRRRCRTGRGRPRQATHPAHWPAAESRSRASGIGARAPADCRGRRRCSSGRGRARRRAGCESRWSTALEGQARRITTVPPT
jgi:hypothetical protein